MKRKHTQRLVVATTVFFSIAGFWNPALGDFQDARVLPAGVARVSATYGQTADINQTFDAGGNRTSITAPYVVDLNAKTMKAVDPKGLGKLIDGLNAQGYKFNQKNLNNGFSGLTMGGPGKSAGDAVDVGTVNPSANGQEVEFAPSVQYGITDRLSIGFGVPIVHVNTTANATLNGPNTAQEMSQAFNQSGIGPHSGLMAQPLQQLGAVNVAQLRQLIQQQDGYNLPENSTQQRIGDFVFGGRFNYYKSHYEDVISSFQLGISAPTGSMHDPSNPTQVDTGTGAWGLILGHVFNYSPVQFLTLSNGFSLTHYLSSAHRNEIVPEYDSTSLLPSALLDEEPIAMDLGDRYDISLGASLHLTRALSVDGGYDWWWKKQDTIAGQNPNSDYSDWSYQTNEFIGTLQAGASFSTIEAFKKKEFPIPAGVSFNVYVPEAGRNATITPYGTLELDLYI